MIRIADYIANFIADQGVKNVYTVSGGGMMFLLDGVGQHPQLNVICNHHEQASAMAAVAESRYNGNLGVCYLTTGCGGTNAITGLLGAWQDNIPSLFVSGQCKRKETTENSKLPLRGFGVQEADIVSVVKPLTKYALMINDPLEVAYHFEKALFLARSGRPGPVWLDIPMDIQGAMVNPAEFKHFDPSELNLPKQQLTNEEITHVQTLLAKAKRPVILAGQGIRLGNAVSDLKAFCEFFQIPVVATYLGVEFLPYDHPLYVGVVGNKGSRAGNLAMQNADLILSLGCHLHVSVTGHEYTLFAREAHLAVIDIDPEEHKKNTVKIDTFIQADVKQFFNNIPKTQALDTTKWKSKCLSWKNKYPVCEPRYANDSLVNLYYFIDTLCEVMSPDACVVSDAGSAYYVTSQALRLKTGQRYVTSGAQAEMGFTLPAAIGVCLAKERQDVIGITGDGSFQMNIQELQTLVEYKLPLKLFVWNNDGYLSIRASQNKFFNGRQYGTDKRSGVSFPNLEKIADAYGIPFVKINTTATLKQGLKQALETPGPVLCEVMCIPDQEIIPNVSALKREDGTLVSKPLEDMYPFLDRETFKKEMIVTPLD